MAAGDRNQLSQEFQKSYSAIKKDAVKETSPKDPPINLEIQNITFCSKHRNLVKKCKQAEEARNAAKLDELRKEIYHLEKSVVRANCPQLMPAIFELNAAERRCIYNLVVVCLHLNDSVNRCIASSTPNAISVEIESFLSLLNTLQEEISQHSGLIDKIKNAFGLGDYNFKDAEAVTIVNIFKSHADPASVSKPYVSPVTVDVKPRDNATLMQHINAARDEYDSDPMYFGDDEIYDTEDVNETDAVESEEQLPVQGPNEYIGLSVGKKRVDVRKINGLGGDLDIRKAYGYTKVEVQLKDQRKIVTYLPKGTAHMYMNGKFKLIQNIENVLLMMGAMLAHKLDIRVLKYLNRPPDSTTEEDPVEVNIAEAQAGLKDIKSGEVTKYLNSQGIDEVYTAGLFVLRDGEPQRHTPDTPSKGPKTPSPSKAPAPSKAPSPLKGDSSSITPKPPVRKGPPRRLSQKTSSTRAPPASKDTGDDLRYMAPPPSSKKMAVSPQEARYQVPPPSSKKMAVSPQQEARYQEPPPSSKKMALSPQQASAKYQEPPKQSPAPATSSRSPARAPPTAAKDISLKTIPHEPYQLQPMPLYPQEELSAFEMGHFNIEQTKAQFLNFGSNPKAFEDTTPYIGVRLNNTPAALRNILGFGGKKDIRDEYGYTMVKLRVKGRGTITTYLAPEIADDLNAHKYDRVNPNTFLMWGIVLAMNLDIRLNAYLNNPQAELLKRTIRLPSLKQAEKMWKSTNTIPTHYFHDQPVEQVFLSQIARMKKPEKPAYIGLRLDKSKADINQIKGFGGTKDIRDEYGYSKVELNIKRRKYATYLTPEMAEDLRSGRYDGENLLTILRWGTWLAAELDLRMDAWLYQPNSERVRNPIRLPTLNQINAIWRTMNYNPMLYLNGQPVSDVYIAGRTLNLNAKRPSDKPVTRKASKTAPGTQAPTDQPNIGLRLNNQPAVLKNINGFGGQKDIREEYGYTRIKLPIRNRGDVVMYVTQEDADALERDQLSSIEPTTFLAWSNLLAHKLDTRLDDWLNKPNAEHLRYPIQLPNLLQVDEYWKANQLPYTQYLNNLNVKEVYLAGKVKSTVPERNLGAEHFPQHFFLGHYIGGKCSKPEPANLLNIKGYGGQLDIREEYGYSRVDIPVNGRGTITTYLLQDMAHDIASGSSSRIDPNTFVMWGIMLAHILDTRLHFWLNQPEAPHLRVPVKLPTLRQAQKYLRTKHLATTNYINKQPVEEVYVAGKVEVETVKPIEKSASITMKPAGTRRSKLATKSKSERKAVEIIRLSRLKRMVEKAIDAELDTMDNEQDENSDPEEMINQVSGVISEQFKRPINPKKTTICRRDGDDESDVEESQEAPLDEQPESIGDTKPSQKWWEQLHIKKQTVPPGDLSSQSGISSTPSRSTTKTPTTKSEGKAHKKSKTPKTPAFRSQGDGMSSSSSSSPPEGKPGRQRVTAHRKRTSSASPRRSRAEDLSSKSSASAKQKSPVKLPSRPDVYGATQTVFDETPKRTTSYQKPPQNITAKLTTLPKPTPNLRPSPTQQTRLKPSPQSKYSPIQESSERSTKKESPPITRINYDAMPYVSPNQTKSSPKIQQLGRTQALPAAQTNLGKRRGITVPTLPTASHISGSAQRPLLDKVYPPKSVSPQRPNVPITLRERRGKGMTTLPTAGDNRSRSPQRPLLDKVYPPTSATPQRPNVPITLRERRGKSMATLPTAGDNRSRSPQRPLLDKVYAPMSATPQRPNVPMTLRERRGKEMAALPINRSGGIPSGSPQRPLLDKVYPPKSVSPQRPPGPFNLRERRGMVPAALPSSTAGQIPVVSTTPLVIRLIPKHTNKDINLSESE